MPKGKVKNMKEKTTLTWDNIIPFKDLENQELLYLKKLVDDEIKNRKVDVQ